MDVHAVELGPSDSDVIPVKPRDSRSRSYPTSLPNHSGRVEGIEEAKRHAPAYVTW